MVFLTLVSSSDSHVLACVGGWVGGWVGFSHLGQQFRLAQEGDNKRFGALRLAIEHVFGGGSLEDELA